jgi:hypothetical protein
MSLKKTGKYSIKEVSNLTKENPSRRKQLIHVDLYSHNWGILLPCPSGVIWEQQTEGVMCNHVYIEGIFFPLREPNDLLAELRVANYDAKPTDEIWKKIKETMNQWEHLQWEEVDNPDPKKYPNNQEGLQWIKITLWTKWDNRYSELIGQIVVLIYPNCD